MKHNYLFITFLLAAVLSTWQHPAVCAETIPVSESNLSSFIILSGSPKLACYLEAGILGRLIGGRLTPGVAFRVVPADRKIRRLKTRTRQIYKQLQTAMSSEARSVLLRKRKELGRTIRELRVGARTCRGLASAWPPDSECSASSSTGSYSSASSGSSESQASYPLAAPLLAAGPGWAGAVQQPAAIGLPDQSGYDAVAIARWDAVPFRTIKGKAYVGVVAFHMNGIDRVVFSANRGLRPDLEELERKAPGSFDRDDPLNWTAVSEMTHNPEVNVKEYWVELDADQYEDDETIEVRAVAYPKVGVPRVLQGDNVGFDGVWSLRLFAKPRNELTPKEYHVRPSSGSDLNPGSAELPFATLAHALGNVGKNGATIILDEQGEYHIDRTGLPGVANTRYITVRPAAGLDRNSVVIMTNGGPTVQCRPLVNLLRFYNVSVDWGKIGVFFNQTWFDRCRFFNSRGWLDRNEGHHHGFPTFITDVDHEDMFLGPGGATLVRNTSVTKVSGDVAQYGYCLINLKVNNFRNMDNWAWHSDVIQYQGALDNIIVYGLEVTDTTAAQMWIFGQIHAGESINNSAFVNMSFDYTPMQPIDVGLSQIAGTLNHIVFKDSFNRQEIRLRTDYQDPDVRTLHAKNVIFERFGLHPLAYQRYVTNAQVPSGVVFKDCYSLQ